MVCNAQAQDHPAKILEVLENDQFIVEIGGKPYLAVNRAKAQEITEQKIDLKACKTNEAHFEDKIKIADQNVLIAHQQREIERQSFVHAMSLYEKERELRIASQQFIPHGKVGGLGGKFLNFLDSPYGQSLFKLVIPTATFIKTMRAN